MPTECVNPLPATPEPLAITFPGGAQLVDQNPIKTAQPALAPLQPMFNVIDALSTTFQVLQAIPDCLGPPPDPSGLIDLLPQLAEKMAKLAGLVPQLSVPLTAVGLLDAAIREIERTVSQLRSIVDMAARAVSAGERARQLGDDALAQMVQCAEADVETAAGNLVGGLSALGGVLGILRPLVLAIGGPQLPDLSSVGGHDLDILLDAFTDLVQDLRAVRDLIPLP